MSTPCISVVMSVFNGSSHLPEAIESILYQDGVEFEFVIVNDGSTDDTDALLSEYESKDKRIRVIRQENTGLTKALIRGCNEARGIYIARQDADDVSAPGRLRKLALFLEENPEVILATSWVKMIAPDGELFDTYETDASIEESTTRLREDMTGVPAHGSVMFKREAYERAGGYRSEFYYAQDCDLWLRMAPMGKIGCVKEFLYEFRLNISGISGARHNIQRAFAELSQQAYLKRKRGEPEDEILLGARELCRDIRSVRKKNVVSSDVANTYYRIGTSLTQRNNPAAVKYYIRSLKQCPYYIRAWKGLIVHAIKRLWF